MCPACLASIGVVLATTASAGAFTAFLIGKVRSLKPEPPNQPPGAHHEPSSNRIS